MFLRNVANLLPSDTPPLIPKKGRPYTRAFYPELPAP